MAQIILDLSSGYTAGTPTGRVGTGSTTAGGGNTGWGNILISSSDASRIMAVNSTKDRIKVFYNSNLTGSATWSLETIIIPLTTQPIADIKMNRDGNKIYILYNRSTNKTTRAKCEIFTRSGTTWSSSPIVINSSLRTEENTNNNLYEDFLVLSLDDENNRIFIGNDDGPGWEGSNRTSTTSKIYVYNISNISSPSISQILYTTAEYSWKQLALSTPLDNNNPYVSRYPYLANKNYASVGIKNIVVGTNKINIYFVDDDPWQFNYNGTWWVSNNLDDIGCASGPSYLGGCITEIPGEDGSLKFNSKKGVLNTFGTSNTDAKIFYNYQSIGGGKYKMIDFEYSGNDINNSSSVFLDLSFLINYNENKILSNIIFGNNDGSIVLVSYKESDKIYFYKRKSQNSSTYYTTEDFRWELLCVMSPNTTSTNWLFGKYIYMTNGDIFNNSSGSTAYGSTKLVVSAENNGNGKAIIYDSPFYKPFINSSSKIITKINGTDLNFTINAIRDDQKNSINPSNLILDNIIINSSELPSGISFNSVNSKLTGSITVSGVFPINITVIRNGLIDTQQLIIYSLGIANVENQIYGKIKNKFSDFKFIDNGSPDSWELIGTLPKGLTFDSNAGILYGTPLQANSYSIIIKSKKLDSTTNTNIEVSRNFILKIAPEISSDLDIVLVHNQIMDNYTIQIFSEISGSDSCTFTSNNLPAGLSLNSSTGVISGTPSVSGTFFVDITATNAGGFDTKVLKISILKITSSLEIYGKIGEFFTYKILTDGNPDDFTADNLPENFYLFGDTIIGNPFFSNKYIIPIKIKKENKFYSASLTLNISPFITDGGVTDKELELCIPYGNAINYKIPILNPSVAYTCNVSSTDGENLSTYGLTLNSTTGVISGTINFTGKKSFIINISNIGGSYTKILNIYSLKITSSNTAIGIYNKEFTYKIIGEGELDYFTVDNLPENFYLFGDTIIGIPSSSTSSYFLNIKGYKNGVSCSLSLNLTIIPGLISSQEIYIKVNQEFFYTIISSVPNPNITILNKPNWVTYNDSNKTLSGLTNNIGKYEITFYINSYSEYQQKINVFVLAEKENYIYKNKYNFYNRVNSIGNSRVYVDEEVQKNLLNSVNTLNELYKKIRC
jgi:hypothetical protein